MKLSKRKVFLAALAICIVAILSFSTLAWFTATDEVTNTFKIADSDGDGTPDFSVDVWEKENDGDDNADADGDGDNTVTHEGNKYENILPGDVIAKNPTVENTGDYDQWIRVYVTFDEFSVIEPACKKHNISSDLRDWLNVDLENWTADNDATNVSDDGDKVTYVYYYNYKLVKDQSATLFDKVTIPGAFEQEDMRYVNGNFNITVKAEAIQSDNTGATAKEAFDKNW